jgi:hypothetical protein
VVRSKPYDLGKEEETMTEKSRQNKINKIILLVGGGSGIILFLNAMYSGWNSYDIWDKLENVGIIVFFSLALTFLYLTVDEPRNSKIFHVTHIIPVGILITTMLLTFVTFAFPEIIINIHFRYYGALKLTAICFSDISAVLAIHKVFREKIFKS